MAKVLVKNFNDETHHTVITSKQLMDSIRTQAGKNDASVEDYYQAVFRFMFAKVSLPPSPSKKPVIEVCHPCPIILFRYHYHHDGSTTACLHREW